MYDYEVSRGLKEYPGPPGIFENRYFGQIEWVDFSHRRLTDSDLAHLVSLTNAIANLDLSSTMVTDDCITHLQSLSHLRRLDLSGTAITDKAFDQLVALPALSALVIENTGASEAGISRFRQMRPRCIVVVRAEH